MQRQFQEDRLGKKMPDFRELLEGGFLQHVGVRPDRMALDRMTTTVMHHQRPQMASR